MKRFFLTLAMLASFAVPALAQDIQPMQAPPPPPKVVQSEGAEIKIPPLYSYTDITDIPSLRGFIQGIIPQNARLLAAYAPTLDVQQLAQQKITSLHSYIAVTQMPDAGVTTTDDFTKLADAFKKDTSVPPGIDSGMQQGLARMQQGFATQGLQLSAVKPGQIQSLGLMYELPSATGRVLLMQAGFNVVDQPVNLGVVVGINVMRLNNRVVYVYAYDRYNGRQTVAALTSLSQSIATAWTAANPNSLPPSSAPAAKPHHGMGGKIILILLIVGILIFGLVSMFGRRERSNLP